MLGHNIRSYTNNQLKENMFKCLLKVNILVYFMYFVDDTVLQFVPVTYT